MSVLPKSQERRRLLSTAEVLQLMLLFGGFILSLLTFVLALIKLSNDKKK
ncbi:putative holin-like toxin [Enterococcus sp. LJL90]